MAVGGGEQNRSGFGHRRGRHALVAIASALGMAILLVLFATPLVLRGPVLRGLAWHASRSLCGTLEVGGGHLDMGAIVALLRQRPFEVALDGVRIREPEGDDLFRARTVRLHVAVKRNPWHIVVDRARVDGGAWRLASRGEGVPLTVALERIPPEGRGACRQPHEQEEEAPPSVGPLIKIEEVTLQDLTLVLSFPEWGVTFDGLDAHGSLDVRETRDGVQILFDARDVRNNQHGSLRIGPAGTSHTFEVPFDRVSIPRVAVTDTSPYDLQLTVAEARTRAARLSGEAVFTDVFAPESTGRDAGMVLSARWKDFGQALERDPPWAAVGRRLAALHAGVRTSLRGPFDALLGSASIDGKGLSLQARLLPHQRYALDASFRALDTRPLVPREQRVSLGGRLDGRLSVSAQLGPEPKNQSVSVDTLALALTRESDDGPHRWVIEQPPRSAGAGAADVRVTLGTVALRRGELAVDPFRLQAPGVAVAGTLRASTAKGLSLRTQFVPESRVNWRGETFRMPAHLDAERNAAGDVKIAPFTITNVAGGAIELGGSIRHDGPLDLHATVARYPLAHLPGVARAHVPGQSARVGQLLAGQLDANLAVRGTQKAPTLAGRISLGGLRWANRPLSGGAIAFDAIEGGTRFQGRLLDGIDLRGSYTRRTGASVQVRLALAPIQPMLPIKRATGTIAADVRWRPKTAPSIDADLSWSEPLSIWPTRLPAAIDVPPARVTLHDDELTLSNLVARSAGVQATAAGHLRIDEADPSASTMTGTVGVVADGSRLGPWFGGRGFSGGGAANLSAKVSGSLRAPRVNGQARFQALTMNWPSSPFGSVRLDGPLAIDGPLASASAGGGPQLEIGPLLARLGSGGWILIAGAHGPGRIQLAPRRSPLPLSGIDLLVRGAGLTTREPIGGISIRGLALALALNPRDPGAHTLRLTGSIHLGRTLYRLGASQSKNKPQPKEKAPPTRHPTALDRIYADNVQVIGPHGAVKAKASYAPTVTVGLHCAINGPIAAPHVAGQVRGSGVYSRMALAIADWFTSRNLRGCDFGPH